MKKVYLIVVILLLCLTTSGCTTGSKPKYSDLFPTGEPEPLKIVTTIFPLYDFTRQLTKNCNVELTMLLAPGEDMHTYKPSNEDIEIIKNSDLFVYLGGESEAWVNSILADDPTIECKFVSMYDVAISIPVGNGTKYEEYEKDDEHVWMYIQNDISIVDNLATIIANSYYEDDMVNKNKLEYIAVLSEIERRFQDIISRAPRKEILVADRFPFIYLTYYYGLTPYSCLTYYSPYKDCSEDNIQSIIDIDYLIKKIKEDNISTVFYTELDDHKTTDYIKEKTGCKTELLHSCHTISQEDLNNGMTFADFLNYDADVLEEVLCDNNNVDAEPTMISEIDEETAVALVRNRMKDIKDPRYYGNDTFVSIDHLDDTNNYVIHVYNSGDGLSDTINWYTVDKISGQLTPMFDESMN